MSLRGADVLARTLAAAGVKQVFALSGNHVMPVFDAALDAKLSLIHVRHEAAAVHMADAWGRLTGEPGIALVTGGPGHANALGALYTALAAQSPMVLISGHAPLDELGKGAFQEMPQAELASAAHRGVVDRASRRTRSARTSRGRCARRATGRCISACRTTCWMRAPSRRFRARKLPKPRPAKSPEALAKREAPAGHRRPGGDAHRERRGGMPVIGMESPRGVNDPSLGKLAEVLAKADVVLLLGKPLDFTLKFGKAFSPECRVLKADAVAGAAASRAQRSAPGSRKSSARSRYRPAEWKELHRSRTRRCIRSRCAAKCRSCSTAPGAVLVADGGEFGQWAQACLRAPRRVINGVAGSIGSALPFAAAAKLAFPDAPVVAMLGDGTFGFHLSEIDTAVRYGLAYVAVVGNDACWNAEHQIQLRAYGARARARPRSAADALRRGGCRARRSRRGCARRRILQTALRRARAPRENPRWST